MFSWGSENASAFLIKDGLFFIWKSWMLIVEFGTLWPEVIKSRELLSWDNVGANTIGPILV